MDHSYPKFLEKSGGYIHAGNSHNVDVANSITR